MGRIRKVLKKIFSPRVRQVILEPYKVFGGSWWNLNLVVAKAFSSAGITEEEKTSILDALEKMKESLNNASTVTKEVMEEETVEVEEVDDED